MQRSLWLIIVLLMLLNVGTAAAQRGQATQATMMVPQEHKAEITAFGGYMWAWSVNATLSNEQYPLGVNGDLDIKSSGFWGLCVDFNLAPALQLELLYQRQDSQFTFKPAATGVEGDIGDVTTQYLQIGTVKGIRRGNVMPYGLVTLGATNASFEDDNEWRFSIMLGLGAKIYTQGRFGFRVQATLPYTFLSGGIGAGVGTGGVGVGFVGTGIAQFNLQGGVFIAL